MARVMGLNVSWPRSELHSKEDSRALVDKGKLELRKVRRPPDCDAAAAGPPGKHLLCA